MKYKLVVTYSYHPVSGGQRTSGEAELYARDEWEAMEFMNEFLDSIREKGNAILTLSYSGFYFHN